MLALEQRIARRIVRQIERADRACRVRAELLGAKIVEDVKRMIVAERDGRECYLCGRWLCWFEVTLDHVHPLSRGGDHTYANVKIACARCNSRKGDRLLCELNLAEF